MCNKKIDSLLPYGDWMESKGERMGLGIDCLAGRN